MQEAHGTPNATELGEARIVLGRWLGRTQRWRQEQ
jgi:hypothetical protein